MDRSLSALIAVCNAESTLRDVVLEMLDVLPELTGRLQLVVIDDCSSDATMEVADELQAGYPQVVAVRHPVPQGRVAAIRTGLDRSSGEAVFFADEDCRLALHPVRRLWAALDQYELVLGRPTGPIGPHAESQWPTHVGGGYQMGYRRVLYPLVDGLGSQSALIAQLKRSAIRWHELPIGREAPRKRYRCLPLIRIGDDVGRDAYADRSLRTDPPDTGLAKAKQRSHTSRRFGVGRAFRPDG